MERVYEYTNSRYTLLEPVMNKFIKKENITIFISIIAFLISSYTFYATHFLRTHSLWIYPGGFEISGREIILPILIANNANQQAAIGSIYISGGIPGYGGISYETLGAPIILDSNHVILQKVIIPIDLSSKLNGKYSSSIKRLSVSIAGVYSDKKIYGCELDLSKSKIEGTKIEKLYYTVFFTDCSESAFTEFIPIPPT